MQSIGASNFEPLPPDQIKTFLLSFHCPEQRVLAWVRAHTICYPCSSAYCVDNRSNELRKVDCARELGLDESVVSRRMARLIALGLIRVDDAGRIYLCGRVAPTPEVATEDSVSETLPPTVRRALESMEEGEAQALEDCLRVWKDDRQSQLAEVVRAVRRQSDERLVQIMATFGFQKKARGWSRSPALIAEKVGVQASVERVAVQASNGQPTARAEGHDTGESAMAARADCEGECPASGRTEVSPSARAVQQVSAEVQQVNEPRTATIPPVDNKSLLINRPIDSGDLIDRPVWSSSTVLNKNKKRDDDKRTPREQPKYVTELDELVAEIRNATGIIEDRALIRAIIEKVETRGGTLREFLDWVKPRARRLKERPGPGFYLSEARKWGSSANQPAPDPCQVSPTRPPAGGKCQCCGGFGRLRDGGYCECSMGRDLARVEKRTNAKSAAS